MTDIKYRKFPCGLCGGSSFKKMFTKTDSSRFLSTAVDVNVAKCTGCGMIASNPRIGDVSSLYNDRYYKDEFASQRSSMEKSRINASGKAFMRIEKITNMHSGRLIDIGCGSGTFLNGIIASNSQWEVHGLDIKNCLQGKSRNAVFHKCRVEDADKIRQKFSMATMIEVAEHLENPVKTFRSVSRILDDDGWLFISTANLESIISKLRGEKEGYYKAPHVSYWSPRTIRLCLEKSGFNVRKITTMHNGNWQHFIDTKRLRFLAAATSLEILNRIHIGNTFLLGGMNVFAQKA
jgi:2-polyprenyl-3-methyl-5-hydroxy-6-metoxy-1,4-benzoquinol methylase